MTNGSENIEYRSEFGDEDLKSELEELGFDDLGEVEKLSSFGFISYSNPFGVEIHQKNGGSGFYISATDLGLSLFCSSVAKLTSVLEQMPLDLISEDPNDIVSKIIGVYDPFGEENMFNSEKTVFHRMVNDRSYEDTDISKKHKKNMRELKRKISAVVYSTTGKIVNSGEVEDENENDVKIAGNWYDRKLVKLQRQGQVMTRQELENTEWAKDYKIKDPQTYDEAIEIASVPDLRVLISWSDEGGQDIYVITPNNEEFSTWDTAFWFAGKNTIKEAVELCKEMGWEYTTYPRNLKSN